MVGFFGFVTIFVTFLIFDGEANKRAGTVAIKSLLVLGLAVLMVFIWLVQNGKILNGQV